MMRLKKERFKILIYLQQKDIRFKTSLKVSKLKEKLCLRLKIKMLSEEGLTIKKIVQQHFWHKSNS
jgi:hypothetical protein